MTELKQPIEKGAVRFNCPKCLKYEMIRTPHERKIASKYSCPMCGFTGPN